MKLSEMLGWEKKVNYSSMKNSAEYREVEAYNIAIESCDREIDREALARVIKQWHLKQNESMKTKFKQPDWDYIDLIKSIISTMPTWLKPTERK